MKQIFESLKITILVVLLTLAVNVGLMTTTTANETLISHSSLLQIQINSDKLTASDGAASDHFGISVATSGDTAIVGALGNDDNGSAYVFTRTGTVWGQQDKLTADDGAADDAFGSSVAISGDTVIVGAHHDDDKGNSSGSAYVFTRTGTVWGQQDKLTADDGTADDAFGRSVAISGDTVIVGAHGNGDNGSAYIFVRDAITWSQQAKLTADDGAALDAFGISVGISGDTVIVGAHNDDDKGSAYIFVRNGITWSQQDKLTASDGTILDHFGWSVDISGDTVIVGALDDDDNGDSSGSAYVFTRTGTIWSQQDKLTASDGSGGHEFGRSVAISGDAAIAGAHNDDDKGNSSGSAYVFTRTGTIWSQQDKLTASDGSADDHFGWSVAISGSTVIVGAYGDEDNGSLSGSAYVYQWTIQPPTLNKAMESTSVVAASAITYTITITNNGSDPMANTTISDNIPPNTTYNLGSATSNPAIDLTNFPTTTLPFTISAGNSMVITYTLTVTNTAKKGDALTNTATVSAPTLSRVLTDSETNLVDIGTLQKLIYLPIVLKDTPDVRITYIEHEGEYVRIQNFDVSPVTMTDWTLRDIVPHIFTFPSFTLAPGAIVRVWTKAGTNTTTDLYWGSGTAIWNNDGDCAYLRSSAGSSVSNYCY